MHFNVYRLAHSISSNDFKNHTNCMFTTQLEPNRSHFFFQIDKITFSVLYEEGSDLLFIESVRQTEEELEFIFFKTTSVKADYLETIEISFQKKSKPSQILDELINLFNYEPSVQVATKPINIYFNRCFTSTADIIKTFFEVADRKEYKIYISHAKENHYLEAVADYFEVEPSIHGQEYVDYCLNFCKTHQIDIFIPRHEVTTLVKHRNEFEQAGIKVMFVGDEKTYRALNDKFETVENLQNKNIINLPTTFKIYSYAGFKKAYQYIRDMGNQVCMKPISGIGGNGFKLIKENLKEIDEIYTTSPSTIALERLERILASTPTVIEPFILSEYLEGEEYSIDCLAKDGELIVAVPRRKIDRYRQNIEYREELIDIAKKLTKHFNLNNLYNIQVRYHHGEAYLIEINTRMSGGIYKACFSGVNFLYMAVQLLLGREITLPSDIRYDFQLYSSQIFNLKNI